MFLRSVGTHALMAKVAQNYSLIPSFPMLSVCTVWRMPEECAVNLMALTRRHIVQGFKLRWRSLKLYRLGTVPGGSILPPTTEEVAQGWLWGHSPWGRAKLSRFLIPSPSSHWLALMRKFFLREQAQQTTPGQVPRQKVTTHLQARGENTKGDNHEGFGTSPLVLPDFQFHLQQIPSEKAWFSPAFWEEKGPCEQPIQWDFSAIDYPDLLFQYTWGESWPCMGLPSREAVFSRIRGKATRESGSLGKCWLPWWYLSKWRNPALGTPF